MDVKFYRQKFPSDINKRGTRTPQTATLIFILALITFAYLNTSEMVNQMVVQRCLSRRLILNISTGLIFVSFKMTKNKLRGKKISYL